MKKTLGFVDLEFVKTCHNGTEYKTEEYNLCEYAFDFLLLQRINFHQHHYEMSLRIIALLNPPNDQFFPRIFLSLSSWKRSQTFYWSETDFFSLFCTIENLFSFSTTQLKRFRGKKLGKQDSWFGGSMSRIDHMSCILLYMETKCLIDIVWLDLYRIVYISRSKGPKELC